MIENVINGLSNEIKEISFVERYGGLVRTARRVEEVADGVFTELKFPVACGVSAAQCWEDGRYLDLAPNDAYKSVCYFEGSGVNYRGLAKHPKQSALQFSANVRFVCWLNLEALGITACQFTAARLEVLRVLLDKNKRTYGNAAQVKISILRQLETNAELIFGKYSYADRQDAFFYPFDFFAFDLRIDFLIDRKCLTEPALSAPIDCKDLQL